MNESSAPAFILQSRVSRTGFAGEERSEQEENSWNASCKMVVATRVFLVRENDENATTSSVLIVT